MRKFYKYAMMAMMLSIASMFTVSCDSNEDEEIVEQTGQRIELAIEGNNSLWMINGEWFGYTDVAEDSHADPNCTFTCNNTGMGIDMLSNKMYASLGTGHKYTYPFTVEMKGDAKMYMILQLMKNAPYEALGENVIKVTVKGFKGNRQTNYFEKTITSSGLYGIGFHADKSDDKVGAEYYLEEFVKD